MVVWAVSVCIICLPMPVKPESADLVVRVFTLPDADLVNDAKTAITTIGSEAVQVSIVGDRAVVKDTVEGMRRIELMFNALLAAEGQYVVEVQFIELSRSLTRRLGIDWNLSGILQFDAAIANRNIDTNGSLRCPVCLASTVLRATPMMKITIQTRISQTMRTSGKREYVLGTS